MLKCLTICIIFSHGDKSLISPDNLICLVNAKSGKSILIKLFNFSDSIIVNKTQKNIQAISVGQISNSDEICGYTRFGTIFSFHILWQRQLLSNTVVWLMSSFDKKCNNTRTEQQTLNLFLFLSIIINLILSY